MTGKCPSGAHLLHYRAPRSSDPHPEHRVYPYLLRSLTAPFGHKGDPGNDSKLQGGGP